MPITDATFDEVWADEGGFSLRVICIDAWHVRVEIRSGIGGELVSGVTVGRWRWDRLVKTMEHAHVDG